MTLIEVPVWVDIISKLWPIALILAVFGLILIFRKSFKILLSRVTTVKIAGQEISISDERNPKKPTDTESETFISKDSIAQTTVPENDIKASTKRTFTELLSLLEKKDIDEANLIFNEIQSQSASQSEKVKNIFYYEYLKFTYGIHDALSKLESEIKSTVDPVLKGVGYYYLGCSFERSSDYLKAIESFEIATKSGIEEYLYVLGVIKISECQYKIGLISESYNTLCASLNKITESQSFHDLYRAIADYFEKQKSYTSKAFALQKALKYNPNSSATLFATAYAYSETDMDLLTLLHYYNLASFNSQSEFGQNNYGVILGKLELPCMATERFAKAVELGNTLAASNLANKYLNGGFMIKAKELLEEAKLKKNVHANVWKSLDAISDKEKNEKEKFNKFLSDAYKMRLFVDEYSDLYFKADSVNSLAFELTDSWIIENYKYESSELTAEGNLVFKIETVEELTLVSQQKKIGEVLYKRRHKDYSTLTQDFRGYFYLSEDVQKIKIFLIDTSNPHPEIVFFNLKSK